MHGRDAEQLMSLPIFATSEGRELGRIKDVLFDPEQQVLLGVLVDTAHSSDDVGGAMFIERAAIQSMGADAVTVSGDDVLRRLDDSQQARDVMESGIHLKGARVLTEAGDAIGKVDKVLIADDGRISGYTTASGLLGFGDKNEIDAGHVLKIGQDAIIVSEMANPATEGRREEADPSMEG